MALCLLPQELILCLADFLPNSSLNALIRTQKLFAQVLTPQLYDNEIKFQAKLREDSAELDPYDLPLQWFHCVDRWRSDVILDYFRTRPAHVLRHTNERGNTLLHIIAQGGNKKLAEILISKGLDIDVKGSSGRTPLFDAASSKQEEMMNYLLDAGADVTSVDAYGRTVLEETALFASGTMVQRVIEALKKKRTLDQSSNCDIFTQSTSNRALHDAIYKGDEVSVRVLLDYGANPSSADGYRATPLVAAATFGHENLIHMLLDPGADQLPYDTLGRSAITCAAEHRFSWNTVQRLSQAVLDVGGDITAGPISGDELAPLHCFARQGCLPVVELLLKHDADILARTQAGVTALNLALFNYSREPSVYEEVCQLLIETINTADKDYDHTLPSIELLRGGTSLHLAAQHGSETLVRLLISSGVNSQVLDDEGNSALDLARLSGHEAVVQVLFDKLNLSHKTENPVT